MEIRRAPTLAYTQMSGKIGAAKSLELDTAKNKHLAM